MKKIILIVMTICSINVIGEEISNDEKKVEKIDTIVEFGPSCSHYEKKCLMRGYVNDKTVPAVNEGIALREIVELINESGNKGSIDIVGHTDSIGSKKYNLELSLKRAKKCGKIVESVRVK